MFLRTARLVYSSLTCLVLLNSASALASRQNQFEQKLADIEQSSAIVGLAVAVVRDGEISFLNTYGVQAVGSSDKITEQTTFRIASLSKAFAATVAVQLDAEKKMSLSDFLLASNPDFKLKNQAQTKAATLNHALSHRLSLPPYAYDNLLESGVSPNTILSEMNRVEPICNVGSCYAYQNVGFNMVASAIAEADNMTYSASVVSRVFDPLDMSGASFGKDNLIADGNWARSHKRSVGGEWTIAKVKPAYYRVPAAGGVNANIIDMSKWLSAQMGNYPQVLSRPSLNRLHAEQVRTLGELRRTRHFGRVSDAHYGLGWRIYQYAGHKVVNHSGSVEGYGAQIAFLPHKNVGIVLLTNSKTKQFWSILPAFLDHELELTPLK
ncbi:MAG: beta-lactamase family protein [Arenicella sp.]|nr:beta-lactamase family protein [Arenicella sp.]